MNANAMKIVKHINVNNLNSKKYKKKGNDLMRFFDIRGSTFGRIKKYIDGRRSAMVCLYT